MYSLYSINFYCIVITIIYSIYWSLAVTNSTFLRAIY
nr:MAG TPA: hypothetical protein [Bacteriophage sp.]